MWEDDNCFLVGTGKDETAGEGMDGTIIAWMCPLNKIISDECSGEMILKEQQRKRSEMINER